MSAIGKLSRQQIVIASYATLSYERAKNQELDTDGFVSLLLAIIRHYSEDEAVAKANQILTDIGW